MLAVGRKQAPKLDVGLTETVIGIQGDLQGTPLTSQMYRMKSTPAMASLMLWLEG